MESRSEIAIEKYKNGYNCAQAVACTYADWVKREEKELFCMTEAFGHGMGSMAGTCGAISGACVLLGLANSTGNIEKPDSKAATGNMSREIMNAFLDQNGSVTCKELKGIGTGKVLCSCHDCIRTASGLVY